MCESIVAAVERRAAGRRVTQVRVRVGALHRTMPEALEQGFELASAGTVAEGAVLDVVVLPARVHCSTCGAESAASDGVLACPVCAGIDVEVSGGDELMLESIQVVSSG